MKNKIFIAALFVLPFTSSWDALAQTLPPEKLQTPGEIVAAAPASDWVTISADDLLIMDLAPDANGKPRRVIIQLMPAPFSQGWVGNIRKLASAHWYDGLAIVRVQDNYVVQWGDPDGEDKTKARPLPVGLAVVPESEYVASTHIRIRETPRALTPEEQREYDSNGELIRANRELVRAKRWIPRDSYVDDVRFEKGWPIGLDDFTSWPVHCYGMVGVGRNSSPDTGTGAELYTVIGHAPRQLDRNIALVGRVISGIEHMTTLPRGTEALGFYKTPAEHVSIQSIRLASELPAAEQPKYEYLSTESDSFSAYVNKRANRKDDFYIRPAGGVDICNVPVPVRMRQTAAK